MLYNLIIFAVAALAIVVGFRRGLSRQIPSAIGIAFGVVCARLLAPGLNQVLYGAFPSVHGQVEQRFVYDTISTAIVFFSVYAIFVTVTGFLGRILAEGMGTILDNIGGALFGLFKWMLFLSIAYNLLLALNSRSVLLQSARSDDGNATEEVMMLSPALLGGEDIEQLFHRVQLEEAKKIS